jgi:hypothetical protein
MEKWKFLPPPGLELRPLGRPARSQSLYRLRYPGSEWRAHSRILLEKPPVAQLLKNWETQKIIHFITTAVRTSNPTYSRISQHFIEPGSSLPCSQEPATGPFLLALPPNYWSSLKNYSSSHFSVHCSTITTIVVPHRWNSQSSPNSKSNWTSMILKIRSRIWRIHNTTRQRRQKNISPPRYR